MSETASDDLVTTTTELDCLGENNRIVGCATIMVKRQVLCHGCKEKQPLQPAFPFSTRNDFRVRVLLSVVLCVRSTKTLV